MKNPAYVSTEKLCFPHKNITFIFLNWLSVKVETPVFCMVRGCYLLLEFGVMVNTDDKLH